MHLTASAPIASVLAASAIAAALSFAAARLLIRHADRLGLQDLPNARSSHQRPTPRGGGIAVAMAYLLALLGCLPALWSGPWALWLPLLAAVVLAVVGLVDDLRGLGLGVRLAAQALAVAALLAALAAGLAALPESGAQSDSGMRGILGVLSSIGLPRPFDRWSLSLAPTLATPLAIVLVAVVLVGGVWWINLFNFMDGIDGLAASQALFMLLASVAVKATGGGFDVVGQNLLASTTAIASLVLAAAVAGFLFLNWAPARIFLGDAGSLFLGFSILAIAAHDVTYGDMSLWTWLTLGSLFAVDATTTLLRRRLTGQRVTSAHRSHVYQRLSRRWGGHSVVALVYCLVNIAWLLPLAILAQRVPSWAPLILAVAALSLAAVAWQAGAGLKESERTTMRKPGATS